MVMDSCLGRFVVSQMEFISLAFVRAIGLDLLCLFRGRSDSLKLFSEIAGETGNFKNSVIWWNHFDLICQTDMIRLTQASKKHFQKPGIFLTVYSVYIYFHLIHIAVDFKHQEYNESFLGRLSWYSEWKIIT